MLVEPRWGPNVATLYDDVVGRRPEATALVDPDAGDRVTYRELARRVARAGNALGAAGVRRGDRVALFLPNGTAFVSLFLGALRLGAVPVPVNRELPRTALRSVVEDSGATTVVTGDHGTVTEDALDAATAVDAVESVLATGSARPERPSPGPGGVPVQPLAPLLDAASTSLDAAPVAPDDPAVSLYTSGSSGQPKGVLVSHRSLGWNASLAEQLHFLRPRDRALVLTPLYHSNTLVGTLLPVLSSGGTVVLPERFDPVAAVAAIDRYDVTYLRAVPAVFKLLLRAADELDDADVTSVQWAISAGGPLSPGIRTRFGEVFEAPLGEVYGATECGAVLVTPRWGVHDPDFVGIPPPDVEVRLVDAERGEPVEDGDVGELLVASPGLNRYTDPAGNASESFVEHEGVRYFRPGDLAVRDPRGYYDVVGRADDVFNVGGRKVAPAQVEECLLGHPDVVDVVAVPVPHSVKGTVPVAFVVADGRVTERDLRAFALEAGPKYAHPRRVFLVDELPRNGAEKPDRRALEADARDRLESNPPLERS